MSGDDISGFVMSEPQKLICPYIEAEDSEENPKTFSKAEYNADNLANGEQFVFTVRNETSCKN